MSKRSSLGQATLFNYFTVSPVLNKTVQSISDESEDNLKDIGTNKHVTKRSLQGFNESVENDNPSKRMKCDNTESSTSDNVIKDAPTLISQKSEKSAPEEKTSRNDAAVENEKEHLNGKDELVWFHNKLEFLLPANIKDRKGRRASDLDYDGRTLYVPTDFLNKQTPAMGQWWLMKAEHYDCVLFFKVGKFYELYHMDAVIGVNYLGISFMKGEFAHSGFPESAYGKMSDKLVEVGYKVARVEQTETPEMVANRNRLKSNVPKIKKVVRREICQITHRSTRIQSVQNIETTFSSPVYLLAICEKRCNDGFVFGICFIDTSIGIFHLGQFKDDLFHSKLLTLFTQYPPEMILTERKKISDETRHIVKTVLGSIPNEELFSSNQFYSSQKTMEILISEKYFRDKNDVINLPESLKQFIEYGDLTNASCKPEFNLAIQSLGACIWYLKECLIDIELLTLGKFDLYDPMENVDHTSILKYKSQPTTMILDAITLTNLAVIGLENSLESKLDYCSTHFGKRLLHYWLCHPSCDVNIIRGRQEAIAELLKKTHLVEEARQVLSNLPDLERQIAKIHGMGNFLRAKSHPDSRAIFYEEKTYSRRSVQEFMTTLNAFENVMHLMKTFSEMKSDLLKQITSSDGAFPEISQTIKFFKESFDQNEAQNKGVIIPQQGIDEEYDALMDEISCITKRLDNYLKSQEKYFHCKISYYGTEKKRYQLDIPESAASKVPSGYIFEGAKKGSKRYTTSETKKFLAEMMAAESKTKIVLKDLNRRIFEKFSAKYDSWSKACYCLAILDVLISLSEYEKNQTTSLCVPDVHPCINESSLCLVDSIHPCVQDVDNFVPNGIELGGNRASLMVLTGPNMGGKTTLMRQVGLLTIMAQIGCSVPARKFELTLTDRIFTRIGSNDNILMSHSTFLVELHEASIILKQATPKSLVLVDELGRGTATYDGTAIATAYIERLITLKCRTVFSTHYHTLLKYYDGDEHIQLGHMACKVENDDENVTQENVMFMYKLIAGACPKSYGFNAAFLAGVPRAITKRSSEVALLLEAATLKRQNFRKIFTQGSILSHK